MNHPLLGPAAAEALAAAMAETDPGSLAAASRLRARFDPDLAAAALTQAVLRRRARGKFGSAAETMWFTPDGLEQASRPTVARWRAARLAAAGVRRVIDLGCGIGADARAFLAAGLEVIAVERDESTAALARANLPTARVLAAAAEDVATELLAGTGAETAIFLDPARRTAQGRSWRIADLSPAWGFVRQMLAAGHPICVKLGPGLPRELIPPGVEACWVSERGAVLETGLWRLPGQEPGGVALLLPGGHRLAAATAATGLPVRPPGRYLLEPDGAVIRARAIDRICADAWLLAEGVAYLSCDRAVVTPFATCFEICEVLDASERGLRAWLRVNQVGVLEIKKRAVDIDPAMLRRRLRPVGPGAATIVLARTTAGVRALVVRRCPADASQGC